VVESSKKPVKIGVFGHYGNKNLGDEAIIEAAIKNLRQKIPGCEIVCLSIDPSDSQERYQVVSFPIRYRHDFFHPVPNQPVVAQHPLGAAAHQPDQGSGGTDIKAFVKSIPVLGFLLKSAARSLDNAGKLKQEIAFLKEAKNFLKDIDLLLVTGSNQFLDNFGGPLGFPYTLFKWTYLAKSMGVKVAFISIGAGPLTNRFSHWLLRQTLKRADYVSYRDEGSRQLMVSVTHSDGPVYPDIAHSLQAAQPEKCSQKTDDEIVISVNPMPVYDKRYWHEPNDEKFNDYVYKLSELCTAILEDGHILELFSTQSRDEDVIDDVIERLRPHPHFPAWTDRIRASKSMQVDELMALIARSDLVVATRFHATVLPLQLGVPVVGICYYRKATELLEEVGLGAYSVAIDAFESNTLIVKYRSLLKERHSKAAELVRPVSLYISALDEQYMKIARLIRV
jgi:polysaccharide pyruvyl transferase WcaK-like protein